MFFIKRIKYNFNTNKVTDMKVMFYECSSLIELNINNFNTNNITDMNGMFYKCSSLNELNLNNFKLIWIVCSMDDLH